MKSIAKFGLSSYICIYVSAILFSFSILSFFFLTSNYSFAEDSITSNVTVSVPVSCSFTDDTTPGVHAATINPGTYEDEIGYTNFKVFCNDSGGFALYAIGYSNEEYGNTTLIGSGTGQTIATGIAQSGNTSNWAMKLIKDTNGYQPNNLVIESAPNVSGGAAAPFSNYHTVPNIYTKVATYNASTDATIGAKLQSTYAAYISSDQMADTYNGKVRYTLVHPSTAEAPAYPQSATPKCISYWPNASGVTDSMADDCNSGPSGSGYGNNASATLWASNFQRSGYGFAGWTDKFDWVLNANDANGNGTGANAGYHIYGPNADITTPADMTTKGLSLYAVWVPNAGNLQSWNGCSTMNAGNVTALTDQRDNNTYAVAKLADGNCWMIENLRLDNLHTTGAENEAKAQGYAKYSGTGTNYGDFIGLADPENTRNWGNSKTANSIYYSGTQSGTATININTSNSPGYRFPRYNNQNTTSPATNMTKWGPDGDTAQNIYSIGNWYTWNAAMANTKYYSSATAQVNGTTSETAGTSICPKGWKLPYGRNTGNGATSGGFYFLGGKLGATAPSAASSNIWRSYPNNFIYSGHFSKGSPSARGYYGYYWSSTVYSGDNSYSLYLGSSNVGPGTGSLAKYNGYSVRCIVGS